MYNHEGLNETSCTLPGRRTDPYRAVCIPPSLNGIPVEDALEPYETLEVALDPVWGEDSEFVEQWFQRGEALKDDWIDWIDWIDLYTYRVDRSDFAVHWLRCLFDPSLPRPLADRD